MDKKTSYLVKDSNLDKRMANNSQGEKERRKRKIRQNKKFGEEKPKERYTRSERLCMLHFSYHGKRFPRKQEIINILQ